MKHIDIEFVNIQSHEYTKFHLGPGLNFILAEDNNVGKSTIFKVIMFAMQMPRVDSSDANELIRGGCTSAKAVFTVEQVVYTLWLFRDGPKQVRAFFETKDPDGSVTRSTAAPQDLKDAFDIVSSNDGKVVNFNDADSIQLVVQDTPKNDEVLAKVLIDLRVENIKVNASRLSQESVTDHRIVKARLDDATKVLGTMHYCPAVAEFKAEYPVLNAACQVLDAVEEPCSALEDICIAISMEELEGLDTIIQLLGPLSRVLQFDSEVDASTKQAMVNAEAACETLRVLDTVLGCVSKPLPENLVESIERAEVAIEVLDTLTRALASMSRAFNNRSRANTLSKELASLEQKMVKMAPRVQCPIKGEVFYTYEECIPVDD